MSTSIRVIWYKYLVPVFNEFPVLWGIPGIIPKVVCKICNSEWNIALNFTKMVAIDSWENLLFLCSMNFVGTGQSRRVKNLYITCRQVILTLLQLHTSLFGCTLQSYSKVFRMWCVLVGSDVEGVAPDYLCVSLVLILVGSGEKSIAEYPVERCTCCWKTLRKRFCFHHFSV